MNRTAFYITLVPFCGLSLLFSCSNFAGSGCFCWQCSLYFRVRANRFIQLSRFSSTSPSQLAATSTCSFPSHPSSPATSIPVPSQLTANTYLFRGFKRKTQPPLPRPAPNPAPISRPSVTVSHPSFSHPSPISHILQARRQTAHSSRDHRDNRSSRPETLSNTKQAAESKRWSVRPPYNVNISSSDIAYHS
jgi:hypothetical protein